MTAPGAAPQTVCQLQFKPGKDGCRAAPSLRRSTTRAQDVGVEIAETKYAKTLDAVNIVYQVRGNGPVDLVYISGFTSNLEVELEEPRMARFVERLSSFARVILFDKRGTGLSDRHQTPDLEMRVDDIRAVLDSVGSERAVLFGESEGGAL